MTETKNKEKGILQCEIENILQKKHYERDKKENIIIALWTFINKHKIKIKESVKSKNQTRKRWEEWELNLFQESFTLDELYEKLPHRKRTAIVFKQKRMGLI